MVPVSIPKPTVGWFFGGWGFQALSASPACYRIYASILDPLGSSHPVLCLYLLHLVGYLSPSFSFLYNHAILAMCPPLGPHPYPTHHHHFHGPVQFTSHVQCTTFSPCLELFQKPLSVLSFIATTLKKDLLSSLQPYTLEQPCPHLYNYNESICLNTC